MRRHGTDRDGRPGKTVAVLAMAGLALALAAAPSAAGGQELARRVSAVEDGSAVLSFATRPGVEICDDGIRVGDDRINWSSRRARRGPGVCEAGPARVELKIRNGGVRDMEVLRRLERPASDAVDLGEVPPKLAVSYFLELARTGGPGGRDLEEAVFPVILADVQEVWRDLMALARDQSVGADTRSSALFWLSQEAAAVVTEGLARVALDEEEDQEVREAAVFALSQRPDVEGVPILMDVARTASHPETREAAMFWLAQSGDERVVPFFEAILLGRGGDPSGG